MSVVVHPGGDLEISGILKQAEILNKKDGTSRSTGKRTQLKISAFGRILLG
jgi:hypothetical protein